MEKIPRGYLKYLIIKLLNEKPDTGYGIINRIERETGFWKPSTGSIYPLLENLLNRNLVEKWECEGRTVYRLTESGKVTLEKVNRMRVEILEKIRNTHVVFARILDDSDLLLVAERIDEKIKNGSPIFALIPTDLLAVLKKLSRSEVDKKEVSKILEDAKKRLEKLLKEVGENG